MNHGSEFPNGERESLVSRSTCFFFCLGQLGPEAGEETDRMCEVDEEGCVGSEHGGCRYGKKLLHEMAVIKRGPS